MPSRFDLYRRLSPRHPERSVERGLYAEIADPVWFLARQWQLGEHQGEDASSPVVVEYEAAKPAIAFPDLHIPLVQNVPAEALVEAEPGAWWTIGRRIQYGERFRTQIDAALLTKKYRLHKVPAPYERFNDPKLDGTYFLDGQILWQHRDELGLRPVDFPEIPVDALSGSWDYAWLAYYPEFEAGGQSLRVAAHRQLVPDEYVEGHWGGAFDWYALDAAGPVPLGEQEKPAQQVMPTQLLYPGAPVDRWWQIENVRVDISGYPPDRSQLGTMLMVDAMVTHATDWFFFPVNSEVGRVVVLHSVRVTDDFGDEYSSETHAGLQPPPDWSLFHTAGLQLSTLVLWPTAVTPLAGNALEEVTLGVDEYANLLWAVERRLEGQSIDTPSLEERRPSADGASPVPSGPLNKARRAYEYRPAQEAFPYWHPYVLQERNGRRMFIQGRLIDYSGDQARPMEPAPSAHLLYDPLAQAPEPYHQIDPAAVPAIGLELERRYMLARAADGSPVLWIQRQRRPLLAPPARQLRFDVMVETVEETQ